MNNIKFLDSPSMSGSAVNKKSVIFYIVWLLALVVIQPTVIQWIRILGVSPDLFIIFVICVALLKGKWESAVIGFIFGLVLDMIIGRMVGLGAVCYMYCGFLTGMLREHFVSDGSFVSAIIIFIAAMVCNLIYYIGYSVVWGDLSFGIALIRTILPKSLYTGVAGLVLWIPIRKSFVLTDRRDLI